jgi:hypothetical protein
MRPVRLAEALSPLWTGIHNPLIDKPKEQLAGKSFCDMPE